MKLATFFLTLPALSFACQQTPLENLRDEFGLETLRKFQKEGSIKMFMFNHAVAHDDLEALKILFTKGKAIQYEYIRLSQADRQGAEPIFFDLLHLAAQFEALNVANYCLENEADVNNTTTSRTLEFHENTPAHIAVICGKHEVLKMLLSRGFNFASKNGLGKTIEDIAREKNDQVALGIIEDLRSKIK